MAVKRASLQIYIFKFILKMAFSFVVLLVSAILILNYMGNSHMLRYAAYSQQLVEKSKTTIQNAQEVTPELIPDNLKYVILDKQTLNAKSGNMDKPEFEKAKLSVKDHKSVSSRADFTGNVYEVIERQKEYCIIHYKLSIQFVNPMLQRIVPYPELTLIILFIIVLLITLYILSLQFTNKMKEELNKFSLITEKIEKQDLDFEVQSASFTEYQKVMDSLDSLRYSLKSSLTSQFEQEKNKREQISALAHDIKIPITIIKGNAELLYLTQKDEKVLDYTSEIKEATNEIEKYMQLLIDSSKNDKTFAINKEKSSINEFLKTIEKDTFASVKNRNIQFEINNNIPGKITWNIDSSSMKRAFMNIIINAIEHTPDGKALSLETSLKDNLVSFVITDSGEGFSKEAQKKATELFYTDNKSRSQTEHYGIGLAFADKLIKAHNGTLHIQNDIYTGGGQVEILLPIISNDQ